MEFAKVFANMMKEGFITIDRDGKIQIYNDRAKEIFGIKNKYNIPHSEGRLEKGDLVIIGNNGFSYDDGEMDQKSLKLLGLKRGKIKKGDSFLLISEYMGENIACILGEEIVLEEEVMGRKIRASIRPDKKEIVLSVDGFDIGLNYINYIGHMLVLDGKNGNLKFYQANGYTARKESINDLLMGRKFLGKGENMDLLEVEGKNIFDIHSSESLIRDFVRVAQGKDLDYRDKYEDINGFPTLCSLKPIEYQGERWGAALIVEDISKIKKVTEERDRILKELEEKSKKLKELDFLKEALPDIIGESEKMLMVKRLALRAASTGSNILILGEKGTGKSIVAKNIHENSGYSSGDFLRIDGSLFKERDLNFEDFSGTIYIHELTDLNLELQRKLFISLDQGYDHGKLRFIFSTSRDLDKMVMDGEFDQDLYYRINVFPIRIPNLEERPEDIKEIVNYLLPIICKRANTPLKRISEEALRILENHSWKGNVKELENVLERSVNFALGDNILTDHIVTFNKSLTQQKSLKSQLEAREKAIIKSSLIYFKGDKKKTMEYLNVSQSSFYEKLKKYRIKD